MMQSRGPAPGQLDILTEFNHRLQGDWRRTNYEGKHFYMRDDIYSWMRAGSPSNVVRLLSAVNQRFKGGKFPEIQSKDLLEPNCLLVFAILLSLKYGYLIQIFHKHNITDERLDVSIEESKDTADALSEDLSNERLSPQEVIAAFEERKWAFNPVFFRHLMHGHLKGVHWVLPFTKYEAVGSGGTAKVYQVLVHQDLLAQDFRDAIRAGEQSHPSLKGNFQFAIKQYTKANESDYKRECHAFRAIQGQEGMVQFLGQFVYDKIGPSGTRETLYNILLEFGEFDLEEFFGDQQQYPPVLQLEIVDFWQSFFKVADAISRVHNLEVETEDRQKKVYRGWHADIKPENILRVYGEFKLADFGFAKFSDVDWAGQIPTSFIHGGTAAYGAPETDIRRRKKGTLTPVSQTIDTWSFGCVLSITASWVILGVQGVYQYRYVRRDAISKLDKDRRPLSHDAFHDGNDVLPAVKHWHQVLRSSMRKCDPITDKILDLIEEKMLVASPTDRIQCKELCLKLDSFLEDARRACHRPETSLAQDVMTSLLEFDRNAPASATEALEMKAGQGMGDTDEDEADQQKMLKSLAPNEPLRAKSQRFPKPDRQIIPQGKFAHRTAALQSALDHIRGSFHNRAPPLNGKGKGPEQLSSGSASTAGASSFRAPSPSRAPSPPLSSPYDSPRPPGSLDDIVVKHSMELDRLSNSTAASVPRQQVLQGAQWSTPEPKQEPVSRKIMTPFIMTDEPGVMTPKGSPGTRPTGTPTTPKYLEKKVAELPQESSHYTTTTPDIAIHGPLNIQQPSGPASEPQAALYAGSELASPVGGSPSGPLTPVKLPKPCPHFSPYREMAHLDEAICKERRQLASVKTGLFKRPKKDETLKQLISHRDFIFVVDRAQSMASRWEWATFLVETLAIKLAGLDDDGLDLVFTSGGDYNLRDVKDATRFRTAMQNATPGPTSPPTDMSTCLGELFRRYLDDFSKQLTLIIVTDGTWGIGGSTPVQNPADQKIVNFIRDLTKVAGRSLVEDRWFSIQFVSFATDPRAQEHLQYLDSRLSGKADIPDLIDTKPWDYHQVNSLIAGSFKKFLDDSDDEAQSPVGDQFSQAGPSRSLSQSLSATPRTLSRSPSGREPELSRSRSGRKSRMPRLGSILKRQ